MDAGWRSRDRTPSEAVSSDPDTVGRALERRASQKEPVDEASPLLPLWGEVRHATPTRHLMPHTFRSVHVPSGPCDDQGKPPSPQLLKYDAQRASSMLAILHLHGTVFASWVLWLHVLCNCALAAVVCSTLLLTCQRPDLMRTERLCELVVYSSALVGLLLVLHVSIAVRRWWAMRVEAVGGLWGAVSDLGLILAAHLSQPGNSELKSLVLRYCLASLELVFMQAKGADGVLGGLVKQKLLSDDEKRKLQELVSKPQAMWVWIAGIFQQLAERGKLSSRLLVTLYGICTRARGAVGRGHGAFAYLDTQLPFSYAHLLAVLVHLNNFAVAAKCGACAAVAIWNLGRPEHHTPVSDSENAQVLLLQILLVVCAPALYHALLEEAAALGDPFCDRFGDGFPRAAYREWMRAEFEALQRAGEDLPHEAIRAADELEVHEGDFVQDLVVAVAPNG
eukprot:gnl/TRDRNA2_/TRDRNA2_83469_c0_seq1.p1 gnl/TRDRNA2_/TRDRNA2_83469_c0~~gnl/TRDRNA2_/TRDRNA2_83469_c0_seq1.p1  ORF type:complete len:450 (-),score=67.91 gnl/TRDRNA2_/TRDRNA2_83469_c0_seq1:86-1435(-)